MDKEIISALELLKGTGVSVLDASYHAKFYRNLPQLQLNMGHHDLSLLRARYINMGFQPTQQKHFLFIISRRAFPKPHCKHVNNLRFQSMLTE